MCSTKLINSSYIAKWIQCKLTLKSTKSSNKSMLFWLLSLRNNCSLKNAQQIRNRKLRTQSNMKNCKVSFSFPLKNAILSLLLQSITGALQLNVSPHSSLKKLTKSQNKFQNICGVIIISTQKPKNSQINQEIRMNGLFVLIWY